MAREAEGERLTTWAAIGAYIGRDARSAKRYEADRGLPVHRLPGAGSSTVYAFRSDLDLWMRERSGTATREPPLPGRAEVRASEETGAAAPPPIPEPAVAPARRRPGPAMLVVILLAASAVLGAVVVRAQRGQASSGAPAVRALYRDGVYAWSRRTPDGLARAIDAFTQAIVRDPGYAPAYAGLADAYDLAPEFGRLPPAQAYPRAKGAAERALALDPSSAAAHRALAFVEFWWEGRVASAMAEFRRALELDPRSAQTHHWYANALAARGDPRALAEFDMAVALSPSTPIMADRAWALVMLGRPTEAQAALAELRRLDPTFPAVGATDVLAASRLGRDDEMLDGLRRWAQARGDVDDVRAVERLQALYAAGGKAALRQGLADREEARLAQGRGDPVAAAAAEVGRGHDDAALSLLQRARVEHSPLMLSLASNPDFRELQKDFRFRSLAR